MCEKGKIPLGTSLGPKGKQLHAGAIKAEAAFVAPVLYSSRPSVARVTQVLGTRLKLRRLQRLNVILEGPPFLLLDQNDVKRTFCSQGGQYYEVH